MEIGELVSILNNADSAASDRCPFCGEAPHGFGSNDDGASTDVESRPDALNCAPISRACAHPYTTAAHHLIPAVQAYGRIRRLVRMGNAVGYDINSPPNGMPLPTFRNVEGSTKFGALPLEAKRNIANAVMDATRAQWHVGSHRHKIGPRETFEWVDESGKTEEISHVVAYDSSVIRLLLALASEVQTDPLCEDGKDSAGDFKTAMDDISREIKEHLEAFERGEPMKSRPFFVSPPAYEYAQKAK